MKSAYAQKYEVSQCAMSHNAACVDDRRTVPVAQRVVQRESGVVQRVGEANGTFVYYHNIGGDRLKDRVPYLPGKICFTPYTGGEVKSANFSGCFLIVFHFVNNNQGLMSYRLLMSNESRLFSPVFNVPYIAHVATGGIGDAKVALFDAENRGLIEIEAMFKPFRNAFDDDYYHKGLIHQSQETVNSIAAGVCSVTGGLHKDNMGRWCAKVYSQERIVNFDRSRADNFVDQNGLTTGAYEGSFSLFLRDHPEYYDWNNQEREERRMDADRLDFETLATKAFFYASIATDVNVTREEADIASQKLNVIKTNCPHALFYALNKLSDSNRLAKIMLDSMLRSIQEG